MEGHISIYSQPWRNVYMKHFHPENVPTKATRQNVSFTL